MIGPDGLMNDEAGELEGLTQEEAGARVLAWAEERGLLEQREPYRHTVAVCDRCRSRIEPLISLQWWCAMDEYRQPALEALREGRVRYHPESQHRFAIDSLEHAPRLEHLAADLVGPPAPGLVLPGRAHHRRRDRAGRVRGVRLDRAAARGGRARHLVLVGALAVRDARLAGRHAGPPRASTRATSTSRRARSSASGRTA